MDDNILQPNSSMSNSCSLCGQWAVQSIVEGEQLFCCPGCRIVYQVLEVQGRLQDYRNTSLFKQAVASRLISNPDLLKEIEKTAHGQPEERLRLWLQVPDLWCPSCAKLIEWSLELMPGVLVAHVDYATDLVTVDYAPRRVSQERLFAKIHALGYHPSPLEESFPKRSNALLLRLVVAAFCTLNVMMLAYPLYQHFLEESAPAPLFAFLSLWLTLPVVFYSGWPLYKRCYHGLKAGIWGMELLVSLGVISGMALSLVELLRGRSLVYFDSVTVIITFVLWGKWLEQRAKLSLQRSLFTLHAALPKRARVRQRSGQWAFLPIKEVKVGDLVAIWQGEKVVVDGRIVEGQAALDESLLTGEVMPLPKKEGDQVLSGSLLTSGSIVVVVTQLPEHSLLHQMVDLVKGELPRKTACLSRLEPLLRLFVPIVLGLALFMALLLLWQGAPLEEALLRFVAILVVACPCAIGIAVPLVEALFIQYLSEEGVLVRNRAVLPALSKIKRWIFDKTGTLTYGKLQVTGGLRELSSHEQSLLKGLVGRSNHPMSRAIGEALLLEGVTQAEVIEYAGQGLKSGTLLLGSRTFLEAEGRAPQESSLPDNLVYFALPDRIVPITFTDLLRESAPTALEGLGRSRTTLLSGDHAPTVASVATSCGIENYFFEQKPLEKRALIDLWKKEGGVAMVGDGINDAAALASADVGISLLDATDLSLQVSDLILMNNDLSRLPLIEHRAKKAERIIRQNLFWAFFYNVIAVLLALLGFFAPIVAAIAMVLSSLFVLLNAQRVRN